MEAGKTGSSEQKNTERTFYMPTDADAPVRAFRKWYNSRGAGSPSWATVRASIIRSGGQEKRTYACCYHAYLMQKGVHFTAFQLQCAL